MNDCGPKYKPCKEPITKLLIDECTGRPINYITSANAVLMEPCEEATVKDVIDDLINRIDEQDEKIHRDVDIVVCDKTDGQFVTDITAAGNCINVTRGNVNCGLNIEVDPRLNPDSDNPLSNSGVAYALKDSQADWNEIDTYAYSFIKNKPNLLLLITVNEISYGINPNNTIDLGKVATGLYLEDVKLDNDNIIDPERFLNPNPDSNDFVLRFPFGALCKSVRLCLDENFNDKKSTLETNTLLVSIVNTYMWNFMEQNKLDAPTQLDVDAATSLMIGTASITIGTETTYTNVCFYSKDYNENNKLVLFRYGSSIGNNNKPTNYVLYENVQQQSIKFIIGQTEYTISAEDLLLFRNCLDFLYPSGKKVEVDAISLIINEMLYGGKSGYYVNQTYYKYDNDDATSDITLRDNNIYYDETYKFFFKVKNSQGKLTLIPISTDLNVNYDDLTWMENNQRQYNMDYITMILRLNKLGLNINLHCNLKKVLGNEWRESVTDVSIPLFDKRNVSTDATVIEGNINIVTQSEVNISSDSSNENVGNDEENNENEENNTPATTTQWHSHIIHGILALTSGNALITVTNVKSQVIE